MGTLTPLQAGARIALVTLGFAAVVGLVAVVDADGPPEAAGLGFAVALIVFVAGGTVACALSCLARGTLEWPAVAVLAAAGLAVDLLVVAAWRDIQNEAYGKVTAILFVWTLVSLLVCGLTIAVGPQGELSRALYLAALVSAAAVGLIATWLIATAGGGTVFDDPVALVGDDGLLRALGAGLVLLATLWFAAVAASRLERAHGLSGNVATQPPARTEQDR